MLHYDLLFALHRSGLLDGLVFQGGTALRLVHGSQRLSEDLDFVGGHDFDGAGLEPMKDALERFVGNRYGLDVRVREPKVPTATRSGDVHVSRWTLLIDTEPARPDMPKQRIRLEVANVPAYTGEPLPLRRNYEGLADSYGGMDSFLITTETPIEIASDKVKSLISSTGYPRYRDIWDLGWAARHQIAPEPVLVTKKVRDCGVQGFDTKRDQLLDRLGEQIHSESFRNEMSRLPWLVAEQEGEVAGYAYASPWKVRQAYRFSVETSVYLAPARTGQGWGRRLYEALLQQLADQGVHAAMGGIVLPNQASVALHESLGMRKVAHFEQVGYKFDRWVDVGYWQIILNSDSQLP